MNDMSSGPFGANPHPVTNPALIPAKRYYDEEFFRLEKERLWPHVWQMACRLEEIPEMGDYVEYRNLDKSVIVVRTKNGVKAFHNACRHRGVQLVEGPGNCKTAGFICPFHGWRWNPEGENTFVFTPGIFDPELLAKDEIDLVPCRVEEWAGMAFINFDNDARPLRECLGPVADRMDVRNTDQLKMEWWYGTVLPTNWKLAMEAFMEGYHVMKTHPQLHSIFPAPQFSAGLNADLGAGSSSRDLIKAFNLFLQKLSDGMAGMVHGAEVAISDTLVNMDLPDDAMAALGAYVGKLKTEIHVQGVARGLPVPDITAVDESHPHKVVEFVFPHFFLLPFYSAMSAYRIRPLTAETCLFEIWSLAFVTDEERGERPKAPTMLPYDSLEFPEIPQQDYSNLPRQQLGLHAGGFENMRLSKDYEGLISNYHRLIDGFLAGKPADALASATRTVNDGFDHPISDIGF